jgi:hypothetical protein
VDYLNAHVSDRTACQPSADLAECMSQRRRPRFLGSAVIVLVAGLLAGCSESLPEPMAPGERRWPKADNCTSATARIAMVPMRLAAPNGGGATPTVLFHRHR